MEIKPVVTATLQDSGTSGHLQNLYLQKNCYLTGSVVSTVHELQF